MSTNYMTTDEKIEEVGKIERVFELGLFDKKFYQETSDHIVDMPYSFGRFCFKAGYLARDKEIEELKETVKAYRENHAWLSEKVSNMTASGYYHHSVIAAHELSAKCFREEIKELREALYYALFIIEETTRDENMIKEIRSYRSKFNLDKKEGGK